MFSDIPSYPSRLTYPLAIKDLQKKYRDTDFSYFPQHIPLLVFNYKCEFYRPFDGYGYKYILSFRTLKKYIEKVMKENNASVSIPRKIEKCKDKYCDYHQYFDGIPIDHDIYLLNLRRDCDNCDMGFAVNEKTNSIYFFFINND